MTALTLSTVLQDSHTLTDVTQVKSALIVSTHVLSYLSCNTKQNIIQTIHKNELFLRKKTNTLPFKILFFFIKVKNIRLICNNILQYYRYYCIFDQINAALVNKIILLSKTFKIPINHKLLNCSVFTHLSSSSSWVWPGCQWWGTGRWVCRSSWFSGSTSPQPGDGPAEAQPRRDAPSSYVHPGLLQPLTPPAGKNKWRMNTCSDKSWRIDPP